MGYANPAAYEWFMGLWSAKLAPSFLRFAGVRDGQNVLDVGCGTGSLGRALAASGESIRVTGIDPAADYVALARQALPQPRAQFLVGAAERPPFADAGFDAAPMSPTRWRAWRAISRRAAPTAASMRWR
jgi:ubiquinone/menaquinone biosynthesis C-methylase UbiE